MAGFADVCTFSLPSATSFASVIFILPQICVHLRGERVYVSCRGGRGLRFFCLCPRLSSPLLFPVFVVSSFSAEQSRSFRSASSTACARKTGQRRTKILRTLSESRRSMPRCVSIDAAARRPSHRLRRRGEPGEEDLNAAAAAVPPRRPACTCHQLDAPLPARARSNFALRGHSLAPASPSRT